MKCLKAITCFLAAAIASATAAPALQLSAGESFSYEFSTLPFWQGPQLVSPFSLAMFELSGDGPGEGERVRLEMFESNLREPPYKTVEIQGSGGVCVVPCVYVSQNWGWEDKQGAVRLTVLSGSIGLSNLTFRVADSSFNLYQGSVSFSAAGPALQVVRSPEGVAIRWPASAAGYVLESSPTVAPGAQWQRMVNPVETFEGMFSVTVESNPQARFFRLRKEPE